jgi:hypothetical protein
MILLHTIKLKLQKMQDKINLIATAAVGVISTEATSAITDTIVNIDIAALTQTIINVLIGLVTIYKLIKPNKKN